MHSIVRKTDCYKSPTPITNFLPKGLCRHPSTSLTATTVLETRNNCKEFNGSQVPNNKAGGYIFRTLSESQRVKTVNYFSKRLPLRCFARFGMRPWEECSKLEITTSEQFNQTPAVFFCVLWTHLLHSCSGFFPNFEFSPQIDIFRFQFYITQICCYIVISFRLLNRSTLVTDCHHPW